MTRREKLLRLCEFDGEALKAHWLNVPSQDDYESAKFENARLLPLITAMAERIETLEAALGQYRFHLCAALDSSTPKAMWKGDEIIPRNPTHIQTHEFYEMELRGFDITMGTMLTASPLDAILEKEK
jgi:hypothetical protein